jgi:hypothetical protein
MGVPAGKGIEPVEQSLLHTLLAMQRPHSHLVDRTCTHEIVHRDRVLLSLTMEAGVRLLI